MDADSDGRPLALKLGRVAVAVEERLETWRVDDEWWRARPIARMYWRLELVDGRTVDVYRDLASGRWYRQSY